MAIACAGYRSRAAAWRAFAGQGLSPRRIAQRMDLSVHEVQRIASAEITRGCGRPLRLDRNTYRRLIPVAAEHGTTVRKLAGRILRALAEAPEIARDILDDGA